MSPKTLITNVTDGQRKQLKRFADDAVDRAITEGRLRKDGAQRLIERGDEFQARVVKSIMKLSAPKQPAEKEVPSSYGYPKGYKPKGITEQANILRELFPGIGYANERLAEKPLPPNAEGWFAIPKWQTLGATYGEAVKKVLAMIASKRRLYNHYKGKLGPANLRQCAETAEWFQKFADAQSGFDILVVPAQFGLHHRGRSVSQARDIFAWNEFGLGAFAVGMMSLTHPERESRSEQLHVACAGDELSLDDSDDFSYAPFFSVFDGKIMFDAGWSDGAYENYGSVSAFL